MSTLDMLPQTVKSTGRCELRVLIIRAHFRYPKAVLTLEHSLELMHDALFCTVPCC